MILDSIERWFYLVFSSSVFLKVSTDLMSWIHLVNYKQELSLNFQKRSFHSCFFMIHVSKKILFFLVADTQLYTRLFPSVGRSVGRSFTYYSKFSKLTVNCSLSLHLQRSPILNSTTNQKWWLWKWREAKSHIGGERLRIGSDVLPLWKSTRRGEIRRSINGIFRHHVKTK